eukprot:366520-Chlamydomonas_euryale.AAC.12
MDEGMQGSQEARDPGHVKGAGRAFGDPGIAEGTGKGFKDPGYVRALGRAFGDPGLAKGAGKGLWGPRVRGGSQQESLGTCAAMLIWIEKQQATEGGISRGAVLNSSPPFGSPDCTLNSGAHAVNALEPREEVHKLPCAWPSAVKRGGDTRGAVHASACIVCARRLVGRGAVSAGVAVVAIVAAFVMTDDAAPCFAAACPVAAAAPGLAINVDVILLRFTRANQARRLVLGRFARPERHACKILVRQARLGGIGDAAMRSAAHWQAWAQPADKVIEPRCSRRGDARAMGCARGLRNLHFARAGRPEAT